MEANSKDIEWLLENATQYMISKETNVPQSKISRLKNGKIKMENLTFEVASELTTFSKKILDILDRTKDSTLKAVYSKDNNFVAIWKLLKKHNFERYQLVTA